MRNLSVKAGLAAIVALLLAACGGSTPTTAPIALPSIALPSIAVPSMALPSIAIPTLPAGATFAIPSFALPSFDTNADPTLAAKFPTEIGGQPVTGVQTFFYVQFMNAVATVDPTRVQQFTQALAAINVDANTVTFGLGDVDVNGDGVKITAFRTPNGDAAKFVQVLPALTQAINPEQTPPTVGQASIGGKNVTTFTDSDGTVTYLYPSGDVAWSIDSDSPDVAATVFAALP